VTAYYIDFLGGDDSHDGLTAANAWKTLEKYTQEARVSGDIAYVRRAKTQVATQSIYCLTYGGTGGLYIKVMADDGTGWPGEEGGARPCLDFNGGAFYLFTLTGRGWWWFEGLEIKNSIYNNMIVKLDGGDHNVMKNCLVHGLSSTCSHGVYCITGEVRLIDCEFYDCQNISLLAWRGARVSVEGCTFNGGAGIGTGTGLETSAGGVIEAKECTLGATTPHSVADVLMAPGPASYVYLRNCSLNSSVPVSATTSTVCRSEDHGQVKAAHKSFYKQGTIIKDTGVLHAGGAPSSAKVEPTTFCDMNTPLTLAENVLKSDFQIWCPASATTITVYIRSLGVWTAYPTAAELYIEAEYWDGATAKRVKSTASTQVLADETTWVAFTTTFTPSAAGWAYVRVNLKKYQSAKGIYVDVKPVVS
jgi:hypothetical protein